MLKIKVDGDVYEGYRLERKEWWLCCSQKKCYENGEGDTREQLREDGVVLLRLIVGSIGNREKKQSVG